MSGLDRAADWWSGKGNNRWWASQMMSEYCGVEKDQVANIGTLSGSQNFVRNWERSIYTGIFILLSRRCFCSYRLWSVWIYVVIHLLAVLILCSDLSFQQRNPVLMASLWFVGSAAVSLDIMSSLLLAGTCGVYFLNVTLKLFQELELHSWSECFIWQIKLFLIQWIHCVIQYEWSLQCPVHHCAD